jgi:hypothetical protein
MVGKHLILDDDYYQRRFYCFGGDGGGGGGGGGGNDSPQTNPGSRERGRGAEPARPAPSRPSRPDYNPDNNTNRPSDNQSSGNQGGGNQGSGNQPTPITAAPTRPSGQNFSARPTPAQNLTTMVADAVAASQTPAPMTDRQMLAASAQAPNPVAAPSAGVTPTVSPGSGNAEQAEMVRQLVENAAQQSIEQGGGTDILDSVESVPGRNEPGSGFFADAYDELYGGTAPGTAVGSILGASPVMSLFGGNTADPADAAAFNVGQLQRMAEATGTGTVNPQTGAVTGVQAGPGTLSMNPFGGVVYSGINDPNYSGPFEGLVRGTSGDNQAGGDRPSDNVTQQPANQPMDPGTTTPEQIDDLAVNYLQNPFYLYSGQGNLFQPYGYAGNTLVDLLQTRNMRMPGQAAPNLGLFGNPRDFS